MGQADNKMKDNIRKGDAAFKRPHADYFAALDFYLEAATHIVNEHWNLAIHQKIRSLITADIDGDGKEEVLFGTEGYSLYAYTTECSPKSNTPSAVWDKPFHTKHWVTGIAVADINEDALNEIIVASDIIYILDSQGEKISEFPSEYPLSALQVYSDADGNNMIVTGDIRGNIKCYNYDFSEKWPLAFKKSDKTIIDLAIGDFDGDGKIEVAAASEDKCVYILDCMGEEKDSIDVNHWIVNMADCRMNNSKLRLFIGKFTGDTLVYKHKQTSQAVSLKQSGILDLKVEYIFNSDYPQFIVGSSDRCLSIFDYSGKPIWIFESGLGQRALSIRKTSNGKLDLFVGTESGDVVRYSLNPEMELVSKIVTAFNNVGISDLMDLKLSAEKLKILRNYIEYNPINQNASLEKAREFNDCDFNKSVTAGMDVWFNGCEFEWAFSTRGRVYDLAPFMSENEHGLLVGSDDGVLYCLDEEGKQKWLFNSRNSLSGHRQGIRGVCVDPTDDTIYTASADKSLYGLDQYGKPFWNFCHDDWMLFAFVGTFVGAQSKNIFVGTEDGYVLAFDTDGVLIWKSQLGKRVRALSFCENHEGHSYLVAGCDDNKVYIIDSNGSVINSFVTPHYVLVVSAVDIDGDNNIEILTGNENGHLHVYDFHGNFLWRFETESWVAALDVFTNKDTGETEIVIGSQDNHVYILNKYGALLWQYEANARVRTISTDSELGRIYFGSYDKNAYALHQTNRETALRFLQELYLKHIHSKGTSEEQRIIESLLNDLSRHKRAFAYLFVKDIITLRLGLNDRSDIVKAAVGSNIVENFLLNKECLDDVRNLLVTSNRRVKAVILNKLVYMLRNKRITKRVASKLISETIISTKDVSSKIDVFRYWLDMTDSCEDILRVSWDLIKGEAGTVDDFLADELHRACTVALSKATSDSGDYTILEAADCVADFIEGRYPDTARKLKTVFI
jgi:outer membrane protein assembly factor BamB